MNTIRNLVEQKAIPDGVFYKLDLFNLTSQSTDNLYIPANLLANYLIMTAIELKCATTSGRPTQRLYVHQDAFRSSQNITRDVLITSCDLSQLDLIFFKGFHQLTNLTINLAANFHSANWINLPPLSNLKFLNVKNSKGLNEWTKFPNFGVGLMLFEMINCSIGDIAMDSILQWILNSSSNTMKKLDISNNQLTKIPTGLSFFNNLVDIYLDFNPISKTIRNGSFPSFRPSLYRLSLASCGISIIEQTTIKGYYQNLILQIPF